MGPKPVAGEDQTGLTPDDRKLYFSIINMELKSWGKVTRKPNQICRYTTSATLNL
jgi:hypothetical protein